jgi:protein ImuB
MFAVVHLPQFSLQAALRHEPELWTKPVALVDPARSTPVVCDATEPARRAGVAEGLTPTQALARCGSVLVRHRSPAQESAATDALLQCASAFSPYLESTAAGVGTLDLRGQAALCGADELALATWAGRFRMALDRAGLRACLGLGATPQLARHAARWSEGIRIVTDAGAFVAALPVAALEPSSDVADILEKWGVRSVGELLALGQEALVDRLGLEALALFAAASTSTLRPLHLVRPPDRFEERFEFEPAVETLEPLLFILRRFVDQLGQRLEGLVRVAEEITLRLGFESGEILERRLRLPEPTRHPDVLFRMLQTHLETLRTEAAIGSVALTLSPAEPRQKQFGLFETALRDPQQFQETLARLAALLGAERVGTPLLENSHRFDAFRIVPPDFEHAPRPGVSRTPPALQPVPMRRLRPAPAARVEIHPPSKIAFDSPASIRSSGANGKLTVTLGPWRASGHWWEPGAWEREEWDVQTSAGQALRLVRTGDEWRVEAVAD